MLIEEPPVAVAAPKRKLLLVLICTAVLLTLVAVVLVVMHANARSQRNESARTIVELEKQVTESGQEEIAANDELKRAKKQEEVLKARADLVATCAESAKLYHGMARDAPGRDEVFRKMYESCLRL